MMHFINTVIGTPLGWVMWLCYEAVKDYGIAILLFTFLSKIILMPVSVLVQKNSIKMIKIQPEMNEIAAKYAGDKDKIAEKQMELYDREKYSPALGCLPMFLQIPLILGLINVIYNPLQHLMRFSAEICNAFVTKGAQILNITAEQMGAAGQLRVVELLTHPEYKEQFMSLQIPGVDIGAVIDKIGTLNTNFLGMDLSQIPPLFILAPIMLIPILSCLSTFWLCMEQNRVNVLQKEQGFAGKWGVTIFTVAFSTYFTFIVPAGVGLYWIFGNVFAVIQMYLLNWIYKPEKYIDYEALDKSKIALNAIKEREAAQKKAAAPHAQKEKEDYKRFFKDDNTKELVFYSESSGFYKYFDGIIKEIMSNSNLVIHYVTSDPEDAVFNLNNPRIIPYYIGNLKLITFMMKLDADMVVMTMPDIESYHIKRSYVRKTTEYVYTDHGISSDNLSLRTHALDHYDTIFCVGPHQVEEARAIEALYNLPKRNLLKSGYCLLDDLSAAYEAMDKIENERKTILIAPSWQEDNIMDSCLDALLSGVLDKGYRVIVRPHPQYVRLYAERMAAINAKYESRFDDNFAIETDFSSNVTIYTADLLITDWSNIGYEFSFATFKPTLYINTTMKVMNPEWQKIDIEPFDIRVRGQIGKAIELDCMDAVADTVAELLARTNEYHDIINEIKKESLFNLGNSGAVGGQYMIKRCAQLKQKRIA
ncbi:MAG: membrane protein insertase YidC, partial [Oscillospiraceae bacterium]